LKLFFFSIEVVDDLFNVSFYLGFYLSEELRGILFLLVLLLWRSINGRWLLFGRFFLGNGFRVRVHYLIHLTHKFQ
jgi:hypothetical protein